MLMTDELSELFQAVRAFLLKEGREQLGEYGPNPKGGKARHFDRRAEDLIIEYFRARPYRVKIISEERDKPVLIGKSPYDYTLVCDPVDGSDNYVHDYPAVTCAIAVAPGNLPVTLDSVQYSLVGNIYSNQIFTARKGYGAFLNGEKLPRLQTGHVRLSNSLITVNFDRGDMRDTKISERWLNLVRIAEGERRTGSACWDICRGVARGSVGAFVDLRGELSAENFLASFGIAREVGCVLTDERGKELGDRDFSDLTQRHRIICAASRGLIDEIVSIIQQHEDTTLPVAGPKQNTE